MNALLRELTDAGIRLAANGDKLHVEAKAGTITPELRQRLTAHKPELLAALATRDVRTRLLTLAEAEALPPELVHQLPAADLQDCGGLPDAQLCAYLSMLADTAERDACRVPATYTARVMCRHCGPVWLSPDVAAVLPVVAGWPRALGCPWCHVTPPEGMAIPRPPITSATCAHYQPDAVNPDGGMGRCKCGWHWPNQRHACAEYLGKV